MPKSAQDEEEYESGSEVDDDDLDDELGLPYVLANIGLKEKRELFQFKKTHTDFDWEKEVLRRSDLLNRKIDMERLQRMAKGADSDALPAAKRGKTVVPVGKSGKGARKRRIDDEDLEDGEDKEEEPLRKRSTRAAAVAASSKKVSRSQVEEEEEKEEASDDGSDNDLFDSDEEAAISSRFKKEGEEDDDEEEEEEEEAPTTGRLKRGTVDKEKEGREGREGGREKVKEKKKANWDDDEGDYASEEDREEREDRGRGRSRGRDGGRERERDDSDDSDSGARRGQRERGRDERDRREREEDDSSPEADLQDHQQITLTRMKLESWINEPFFEKAVIGAFVRVVIGSAIDRETEESKPIYRMGVISHIDKGQRAYKMMHFKGLVEVRLSVAIGKQIKPNIKITLVSNSRIAPHEFEHYRTEIEKARGYKMLTKKEAGAQLDRMVRAVQHKYTTGEIDAMVVKKLGYGAAVVTTDETNAMNALVRQMEAARAEKDFDKMDKIGKAIQSLTDDIILHKEQAELMSSKQVSVNIRNKTANFEKDIHAGVVKRQKEAEAAARGNTAVLNDPFVRRETRPKILWNTGTKLQQAKDKTANVAAEAVVAKVDDRKAEREKERERAKEKERVRQQEEESWRIGSISLDEVRSRVKARLGVDPYEVAKEDRRERYLRKVCQGLPPLDSQEREGMRRGLSLAAWVERERERERDSAALEGEEEEGEQQ